MVSLVRTISPRASNGFGTLGRAPEATTIALAATVLPSSSAKAAGPVNLARCWMRMPGGISSIDFSVAATNASRSLRTRSITACPSTLGFSVLTPNVDARRMLCAAFAAAISNFEGMQPTVAQVVPAN